jgi:hypothetical protein
MQKDKKMRLLVLIGFPIALAVLSGIAVDAWNMTQPTNRLECINKYGKEITTEKGAFAVNLLCTRKFPE